MGAERRERAGAPDADLVGVSVDLREMTDEDNAELVAHLADLVECGASRVSLPRVLAAWLEERFGETAEEDS